MSASIAAVARGRRLALALAFVELAALLWPARAALAQQAVYDESRVKAAFLVRFGQFVQWPDLSHAPGGALVITVAGAEAVYAGVVQGLAERNAQGRPIVARRLKGADDLAQTHILFIGSDMKGRLEQHVAAAAGRPVLIVTEFPDALERGSMINFVTVDNRVRFEVGLESAEKAGLAVSSRLLSIAMRVHRGGLPFAPLLALRGTTDPATFTGR
jgi:hypothetical protein